MNITLTKAEALAIQQRHIAHYLHLNHQLPELVAERTTAHLLEDGVPYPVHIINQHIPRDIATIYGAEGVNYATKEQWNEIHRRD